MTDRYISEHSVTDEKANPPDLQGVSDAERKKRKRVLDHRSGADLKKRWEQGDREELEVRAQENAPPRITVPQCHVCVTSFRDFIEEALVRGHSYERIAQEASARR